LCPNVSIDSNSVGVWIPTVNGAWIPPIFVTSYKKKHIILMTICPSLNGDGKVGMQLPTSFLMLLVNTIDVILLNDIIFHHGLPHVDPCPPNCLGFVIYLFHRVLQAQWVQMWFLRTWNT
jgi:hypothetical protein